MVAPKSPTKLINGGLIVSGCLVVHHPSAADKLQLPVPYQLLNTALNVIVLHVPPLPEERSFDVNKSNKQTQFETGPNLSVFILLLPFLLVFLQSSRN